MADPTPSNKYDNILARENIISIAQHSGAWIPDSMPSDWVNGDIIFSQEELEKFTQHILKIYDTLR